MSSKNCMALMKTGSTKRLVGMHWSTFISDYMHQSVLFVKKLAV
jgi:hypothetical protein